jgi:hypothetical protein
MLLLFTVAAPLLEHEAAPEASEAYEFAESDLEQMMIN